MSSFPYDMNILYKLAGYVTSIRIDASLSAVLRQKIKQEKSTRFIPEDYFYLTHVINPIKFFWEHKVKGIEKPIEIDRKLNLGKKLERTAKVWFKNLPDFFLREGKLDGAYVGIPGVRGSIDYKIGDSIIEFKTKDELPNTPKIIFEKYPQDVEQLAFYAVLDPDKPIINYLVFMNNIPKYKLQAFKIKITDFGKIKTLLLNRIKTLREAINEDNPSKLGCCRYFESGCEFDINKICSCSKINKLSNDLLISSLEISYDEEFTKKLENAKTESFNLENYFSTKDIIAPRKYYMVNNLNLEESWESDSIREGYLACLGFAIKKLSLNPTISEYKAIKTMLKESRIFISQKWIKPKSSTKTGYDLIPYTVKISKTKDMKYTGRPHVYHQAEMALICAAYGRMKGLVFVIYPNLNDFVQVYEVIINKPNEILQFIKSVIDILENNELENKLTLLHPCPTFMNNDETCPLMTNCNNKEDIEGCIK